MYDHIGLGFGPANLALCIALHESRSKAPSDFQMCFLEQQPEFAWHPSLLLPGAQLQVSPLKDLATMRDPTSPLTFLNYLHSEGRLMQYINREEKVPSRREWSAYLAWAARQMQEYVRFGMRVVDVVPVVHDGRFSHYKIVCENTSTGATEELAARNISLAVGGTPQIPDVMRPLYTWPTVRTGRVVHSASFLPQMAHLAPVLDAITTPMHFAVVGGGQSSAEMLRYLRDRFPRAALDLVFRASALVPSDDSPFVNSAAFDPASVTAFWESSARQRHMQLAEFHRTNYAVVRSDLLNELYEIVYDQDIDYREPGEIEKGRVRLLPNTRIERADAQADGRIKLTTLTSAGAPLERSETYDAVFLGTGFQRDPSQLPFLQSLAPYYPLLSRKGTEALRQQELELDDRVAESREPDVLRAKLRGITRDYRLVPNEDVPWAPAPVPLPETVSRLLPVSRVGREGSRTPSLSRSVSPDGRLRSRSRPAPPSGRAQGAVYVFGSNEATHGLADSLMSMVAHRAGVVAASLLENPI